MNGYDKDVSFEAVVSHPQNPSLTVKGRILLAGETLRENDVYNSSTGAWTKCPCPGVIMGNTAVIWVRPYE